MVSGAALSARGRFISIEKMNKENAVEKNELIIKRSDFEKYQLVLPYRFLFGRSRQRFIYSELEKMHPCFSDEFYFDSKIKGLSKKGAVSDVMVIHKYTLAEYETKRPVSGSLFKRLIGSGFFAESCKEGKIFVNKRIRIMGSLITFLLVLAVLLLSTAFLSIFKHSRKNPDIQMLPTADTEALVIVPANETDEKKASICESFFSELRSGGGKLQFFQWKIDGFNEVFKSKILDLYPEQLSSVKVFDVIYENARPVIEISESRKLKPDEKSFAEQTVNKAFNGEESFRSIRSLIFENGGKLKKESLNPYSVEFSCKKERAAAILSAIDECFCKNGKRTAFINISEEKGEWNVSTGEMDFRMGDFASVISLKLLADNFDLFYGTKERKNDYKNDNPKTVKNKNIEKDYGVKIGEIKNADGKKVCFYKNAEGKILKIKEENK